MGLWNAEGIEFLGNVGFALRVPGFGISDAGYLFEAVGLLAAVLGFRV